MQSLPSPFVARFYCFAAQSIRSNKSVVSTFRLDIAYHFLYYCSLAQLIEKSISTTHKTGNYKVTYPMRAVYNTYKQLHIQCQRLCIAPDRGEPRTTVTELPCITGTISSCQASYQTVDDQPRQSVLPIYVGLRVYTEFLQNDHVYRHFSNGNRVFL
jgi:hypothetical protein